MFFNSWDLDKGAIVTVAIPFGYGDPKQNDKKSGGWWLDQRLKV